MVEGNFTPDFKKNGFCICYNQEKGHVIQVGWYRNDLLEGNFMKINGKDMTIIKSGYRHKDG